MIALINNDETKLGQFEFIQIAILKRIKRLVLEFMITKIAIINL